MVEKTSGQVAFESHWQERGVTDIRPYYELESYIRRAWEASAEAVRDPLLSWICELVLQLIQYQPEAWLDAPDTDGEWHWVKLSPPYQYRRVQVQLDSRSNELEQTCNHWRLKLTGGKWQRIGALK